MDKQRKVFQGYSVKFGNLGSAELYDLSKAAIDPEKKMVSFGTSESQPEKVYIVPKDFAVRWTIKLTRWQFFQWMLFLSKPLWVRKRDG